MSATCSASALAAVIVLFGIIWLFYFRLKFLVLQSSALDERSVRVFLPTSLGADRRRGIAPGIADIGHDRGDLIVIQAARRKPASPPRSAPVRCRR